MRATLETGIEAIEGDMYTPLAETLFNVYRYFQSRSSGRAGAGQGRHDALPRLRHQDERRVRHEQHSAFSRHRRDCQKHFVILLTDGEPLRDDFVS